MLHVHCLSSRPSLSPADEVLEHGRLSRRLATDDCDLRQVYDHGHAELREDVLYLVDEGDEGLHPDVALLLTRHGGGRGRRVVDAAGHCKGLLHLLRQALAVVVDLALGLLLLAFDRFSFAQDVVSPLRSPLGHRFNSAKVGTSWLRRVLFCNYLSSLDLLKESGDLIINHSQLLGLQ